MKVRWVRQNDKLNYNKPNVWFCLGTRGSGKSSFLESVGEQYLNAGNGVLDLFGSRDGEALAWLRSPWVKDRNVLLLKGENVDVQGSWPVKAVEQLSLSDFEKYDLIISASPLYLNLDSEYHNASKITDLLYKRIHYKKLVYLCCREASNLYYSRLKVSDNQLYAKAQMVYLLREMRHMGIAIGLDSLRFYSLDIDVRSLADYLILKAQGVQGLSKDLKWLYRYVDASLIRKLEAKRFIIITKNGAIGYGIFPEVAWHKKEKENILENVGLKIEYGEQLKEAVLKGTFKTVSDREHVELIRLYQEENLSMIRIAELMHRSSRTLKVHIDSHNAAVERSGFCAACKRAKGMYAEKTLMKSQF